MVKESFNCFSFKIIRLIDWAIKNILYLEVGEGSYRFRNDLKHSHYLMSEGFEMKFDDVFEKLLFNWNFSWKDILERFDHYA
ncbi:hypothetical protein CH370_09615 [Leptospira kmetyi]|nr:hypothetical protein CH370_09615 [Leptospira kmetyi]